MTGTADRSRVTFQRRPARGFFIPFRGLYWMSCAGIVDTIARIHGELAQSFTKLV